MNLNIFFKNKKENIIRIIGFISFICILFKVFCSVTYLFRNAGSDRTHIVGIKCESDLDMVYIGGSAAFVYWEPLKAWSDCGFTSYNFATNSIQAENIKAYIEETERYHKPNLYVIGARAFQYYEDEQVEAGLRNGSDSMDITSPARYDMLNSYFDNRIIDENTDILSYYLDIAKYHTNTENLESGEAWGFINNEGTSPNKGWEWMDLYAYLNEPKDFYTDERADLPENAMKTLDELLEYCVNEDLNVLFVVCPYVITREDQAKYNTIKDRVEKSGFRFLNTNEYYREMNLDFSTDFYHSSHVNLFGASKYTAFLEDYIVQNYDMPDHRTDSSYSAWDDDADRFFEEEKGHSRTVMQLIDNAQHTEEIVEQLKSASSLAEWNALAADDRFTILIEGIGEQKWPDNLADQKILSGWHITPVSKNFIRVVCNSDLLYSNADDDNTVYDGRAGVRVAYHIAIGNGSDELNELNVGDSKLTISDNGINIALIDNVHQKLAQQIFLYVDETGEVCIEEIQTE